MTARKRQIEKARIQNRKAKREILESVKDKRLTVQLEEDILDWQEGKIATPPLGAPAKGKQSRNPETDRIIYTVDEIMKTRQRLETAQKEYNKAYNDAVDIIDKVNNAVAKTALKYHYLPPFWEWKEIGDRLGYDFQYLQNKASEAL